ncbi:hypothetical protein CVIRNUC_006289 [Coccomyxa viridis]|uniref:DNA polymerase epsilon subunit n=1 Tax=Coccomyxa viridis TaxID=1274662 RepID=A0AAV1IAX7_9CHLO|nr:hypothetical protein CVIRNUC_006289 [Coccomyxa viridis]
MASVKKQVQAAFFDAGLALEREALSTFVAFIEENGGEKELIYSLLDSIVQVCASSATVTQADAQKAIDGLCGHGQRLEPVQVISAFQAPKLRYDPIRKIFFPQDRAHSLHGTAEDKIQMHLDRMYLLLQRLRRNRNFSRPAFAGLKAASRGFIELTELKALLGCVGETRFVMGCISQLQDGRYFLEDLSDALPIELSEAQTTSGFFTENCIVVAEGVLQHSGAFKVRALGFPPVELRGDSRAAAKHLDFFGGRRPSEEEALQFQAHVEEAADDRVVFLSDVWLDKPATHDRLRAIFEGFEQLDQVPSMFVLMGSFQSFSCGAATTDYASVKANFTALAQLIAGFTRITEESKLVFVPGTSDAGPAAILPRPPLPEPLIADARELLPNAVFATNPCRIRFYNQEMVIFRDDLQNRMRKLCLLAPNDEGSDSPSDAMFEHLCATLLQQSHLCPVPLEAQPVFWNFDHALHLYPIPDVLVLADRAPCASFAFPPMPADQLDQSCVCLNPGSFMTGAFAAYAPSSREVEPCDVPEEE